MPKEVIKEWPGSAAYIDVRWGEDNFEILQIYIDRGSKFQFNGDEFKEDYTGLAISLHAPEDVDRLIKALKRAKRKQFKD